MIAHDVVRGDPLRSPATLDDYVRHAARGAEYVFETAAGLVHPYQQDLSLDELGTLSRRLQKIDPHWSLPKGDDHARVLGVHRAGFALELIDAGWKRERALEAAQISRSTLQRALREPTMQDASWRVQPSWTDAIETSHQSRLPLIEWHADGSGSDLVRTALDGLGQVPKWGSNLAYLCGADVSNQLPLVDGLPEREVEATGVAA